MAKDVIVALDFASGREVFEFLNRFGKEKPFVNFSMPKVLRF